jgi:hypothetical protein
VAGGDFKLISVTDPRIGPIHNTAYLYHYEHHGHIRLGRHG